MTTYLITRSAQRGVALDATLLPVAGPARAEGRAAA